MIKLEAECNGHGEVVCSGKGEAKERFNEMA